MKNALFLIFVLSSALFVSSSCVESTHRNRRLTTEKVVEEAKPEQLEILAKRGPPDVAWTMTTGEQVWEYRSGPSKTTCLLFGDRGELKFEFDGVGTRWCGQRQDQPRERRTREKYSGRLLPTKLSNIGS